MAQQDFVKRKKILLGHLGKMGDCLYATVIARQIKKDYPSCHLTWAVSSMCRSVIDGNPDIDEIWELPLKSNEEIVTAWKQFESDARKKKASGEYDDIYLTQVDPNNYQNYDGTVRASIYRGYPNPITVSMQPVVRLSEGEIENVRRFAEFYDLLSKKNVVLFEYAAASGQSYVNHEFASEVVKKTLNKHADCIFILSSNKSFRVSDDRVIDGSVLSFKENAELTKYCTLLVGCSSGISWLATADWAKPLPKIQLLSADKMMYASMIHDAKYCGFSVDQILEMQDCLPDDVASCIQTVFNRGFNAARRQYGKDIREDFRFYFKTLFYKMLDANEMGKAVSSLKVTMERFGRHPQLIYFRENLLLPYLNIVWPSIPKHDQDFIIRHLNANLQNSQGNMFQHVKNSFRIIKALFRKDMHWMAKALIRNLGARILRT